MNCESWEEIFVIHEVWVRLLSKHSECHISTAFDHPRIILVIVGLCINQSVLAIIPQDGISGIFSMEASPVLSWEDVGLQQALTSYEWESRGVLMDPCLTNLKVSSLDSIDATLQLARHDFGEIVLDVSSLYTFCLGVSCWTMLNSVAITPGGIEEISSRKVG